MARVPHPPAEKTHPGAVARSAYGSGRLTAPRAAIASVVAATHDAFTVEELTEAVHRVHPEHASTATVYRAVAAMASSGFIERIGSRGGSALYARCDACDHHHHIVCDGCGRTAQADCPLGAEATANAQAHGFTITRHEVTLYGLCRTCSAKGPVA